MSPMPKPKKLDGIPVRIPGGGMWPPQDVFVNFRLPISSNVDRVGWDVASNMYVSFKHGGPMYVFMGVSRQRVVALAYSRSPGRYLHQKIRGKYPEVKLEDLKLKAA